MFVHNLMVEVVLLSKLIKWCLLNMHHSLCVSHPLQSCYKAYIIQLLAHSNRPTKEQPLVVTGRRQPAMAKWQPACLLNTGRVQAMHRATSYSLMFT